MFFTGMKAARIKFGSRQSMNMRFVMVSVTVRTHFTVRPIIPDKDNPQRSLERLETQANREIVNEHGILANKDREATIFRNLFPLIEGSVQAEVTTPLPILLPVASRRRPFHDHLGESHQLVDVPVRLHHAPSEEP